MSQTVRLTINAEPIRLTVTPLTYPDVERTFTITGVAPVIDNRDGTLQDWTLTGNSTPTFDMMNGGFILTINNAGNFSLDLSGVEFVSQDPTDPTPVVAPVISQTKLTKLTIWADGADVYAQLIGYVSI